MAVRARLDWWESFEIFPQARQKPNMLSELILGNGEHFIRPPSDLLISRKFLNIYFKYQNTVSLLYLQLWWKSDDSRKQNHNLLYTIRYHSTYQSDFLLVYCTPNFISESNV